MSADPRPTAALLGAMLGKIMATLSVIALFPAGGGGVIGGGGRRC